MKFNERKFHIAIKQSPIGLTKRQQGHVMGAVRDCLEPDATVLTPQAYKVHVATLRASNGTTYVVCIDRTDIIQDKWATKGRITPFQSANEEHAHIERAVWDRFLNGDGDCSMVEAMVEVGLLSPIKDIRFHETPT